jgi:hypothetical protein
MDFTWTCPSDDNGHWNHPDGWRRDFEADHQWILEQLEIDCHGNPYEFADDWRMAAQNEAPAITMVEQGTGQWLAQIEAQAREELGIYEESIGSYHL